MSILRELYTPIQPTIRQTTVNVCYKEFLPAAELQNYIYCYWQLKSTAELEAPFYYRVVADGCIDIFFERNKPGENYVMGFCKKFTEFPLGYTFNYFGIRFLPTMFSQIFRVNAKLLSNRYEHLSLIVPPASSFITNQLNPSLAPDDIIKCIDDFLSRQVLHAEFDNDHRLYDALEIILRSQGMVNIETGLGTGLSQRQLRRVFEYYIGDTPKVFSKVVRFQNILKAKPSSQSLRQNKLFFDVGYYDQAHFIKEFKNLYGVTPSKAFGR